MKITKQQLKQLIREEKRKLQEVYPVGGQDTSQSWEVFRDAVWHVAGDFISAGMEADGVMSAMQDEVEQVINEIEAEMIEDEDGGGEEWTATSY